MFTNFGRILMSVILFHACRGKDDDLPAQPTVDATVPDSAADAATDVSMNDCHLADGNCVGVCGCTPVRVFPLDLDRKCREPLRILACRTHPDGTSNGCGDGLGGGCLQRPTSDGGVEVFRTPADYNYWDAGDLKPCSEELQAQTSTMTVPCP